MPVMIIDVLQEDVFNLGASDADSKFCEWVQWKLKHISLIKGTRMSSQAPLISVLCGLHCWKK